MNKPMLEAAAQELARVTADPPFLYELGPEAARTPHDDEPAAPLGKPGVRGAPDRPVREPAAAVGASVRPRPPFRFSPVAPFRFVPAAASAAPCRASASEKEGGYAPDRPHRAMPRSPSGGRPGVNRGCTRPLPEAGRNAAR